MSSTDDMPPPPGRTDGGTAGRTSASSPRPPTREADMGLALRSVYQRTVEEDVPDEMMDLLGKLG